MGIKMPDYSVYIEYYAYAELRIKVMESLNSRGVERVTLKTVNDVICEATSQILKNATMECFTLDDSINELARKNTYNNNVVKFIKAINDASRNYKQRIKDVSRPTVITIGKLLNKEVKRVEQKLLNLA